MSLLLCPETSQTEGSTFSFLALQKALEDTDGGENTCSCEAIPEKGEEKSLGLLSASRLQWNKILHRHKKRNNKRFPKHHKMPTTSEGKLLNG